jgi:hypothetical protein
MVPSYSNIFLDTGPAILHIPLLPGLVLSASSAINTPLLTELVSWAAIRCYKHSAINIPLLPKLAVVCCFPRL